MLHGLKVVMAGQGRTATLTADQRVREADETLTYLQKWFPQLEAAVEDNERVWSSVNCNWKSVSKAYQQLLPENHHLYKTAVALHDAGSTLGKPLGGQTLHDEYSTNYVELRAFNESIRQLRALLAECVSAMKNRDYYASKLDAMLINEGKKKAGPTEKEVEKRVRNEQKLANNAALVHLTTEKMHYGLEKLLGSKEMLLEKVLRGYVKTQDYIFNSKPIAPVVVALEKGKNDVRIDENSTFDITKELEKLEYSANKPLELEQPPRPLSPTMSNKEFDDKQKNLH